jgi:hypothetical protein
MGDGCSLLLAAAPVVQLRCCDAFVACGDRMLTLYFAKIEFHPPYLAG